MDALSTSKANILDLQSTGFEFVATKIKRTLYSNRIENGWIEDGVQAACRYKPRVQEQVSANRVTCDKTWNYTLMWSINEIIVR